LVSINSDKISPSKDFDDYLCYCKKPIDNKYDQILSTTKEKIEHSNYYSESALGNLLCDVVAKSFDLDISLFNSKVIRSNSLGPIVTLRDFYSCFPYDDILFRAKVSGVMLRKMFNYFLRNENRNDDGIFFHFNQNIKAVFSKSSNSLVDIVFKNQKIHDNQCFTISIQNYQYNIIEKSLGITRRELTSQASLKVITYSFRDVVQEYFNTNNSIDSRKEGRLTII